ncbi:hypothetical protein IGX44_005028, partial [Escherichia coli]|nr:hypothetical protein [Escherichia coli]
MNLCQKQIDDLIDVFSHEKFTLVKKGFKRIYRLSWSVVEKFPNGVWFTTNIEYAKKYKAIHSAVASSNQKNERPFLYEAESINDLNLLNYNGDGFFNDMKDLYSSVGLSITQGRVIRDLSSFIARNKFHIDGFYMKKDGLIEAMPVDEILIPNAENSLRLIKTTDTS